MPAILGVSAFYHDSAAALIDDHGVRAACQEERLSRIKGDPGLPHRAMAACLEAGGIRGADLEAVAFYERPLRKLARIHASLAPEPDRPDLAAIAGRWLASGQMAPARSLARTLGCDADRVVCVGHHESHAASAFFAAPFDSACVVCLDGVGEAECGTIWHGTGTRLTHRATIPYPHSLGLFYSAFTAYLGFEVNEGEYKVMGMAPFGRPTRVDDLMRLFRLLPDGTFHLDQRLFDFRPGAIQPYSQALIDWLGPPRPPEDPFDPTADGPVGDRARHYADIAASVQAGCERVIAHVVGHAMAATGEKRVCLAGGVALNSVANGRLIREQGADLYIQPAAGDAGAALGAALWHRHMTLDRPRLPALTGAALGRDLNLDATEAAIRASGLTWRRADGDGDLVARVADRLADGQVIGWVQGRAEWGPRALGHRSILAVPTDPAMQNRVNAKVKFRELFRPFAPAVPADRAGDYFDLPRLPAPGGPEDYMLAVHPVRPEWRDRLPAITHVDGSARVQTVRPDASPLFHALLQAVGTRTGIPVLLNTSFNRRGEPMVDDAIDALATFRLTGLDVLVVGPFLVERT